METMTERDEKFAIFTAVDMHTQAHATTPQKEDWN